MKYIGLDGCKYGWFCVCLRGYSNWEVDVFRSISSLWKRHKDASIILIDIPIGLRESGSKPRLCDKLAREILGRKYASSIFPTPCRRATYTTLRRSSRINKKMTGKKLSLQSLNIIPRIRQIDRFLLKNKIARSLIRETHPEICFWALAGKKKIKFNKKTENGFQERFKLLNRLYPQTRKIVDFSLYRYSRQQVAKDDILDSLSGAVTAFLGHGQLSTLPDFPEHDSKGLPMEIVFFEVQRKVRQ